MDWIQIGTNVGVLIGLVLVAIQVRQSTTALKGSSYQMWVASNMELNAAATQSDLSTTLFRGWVDSRGLSDETFIQFAQWVLSVMQMAQATNYLYKQGSMDRALWETEMSRAALILTAPGVRQWWDAGGRTQVTPEFAALVESTTSEATTWGWTAEQGFIPFDIPST